MYKYIHEIISQDFCDPQLWTHAPMALTHTATEVYMEWLLTLEVHHSVMQKYSLK